MSFDDQTTASLSAKLTVLQGFSQGAVYLVDSFPVVIGRGGKADVIIDDNPNSPTISRSHFRLSLASGRVQLEDLSSNGTSIDKKLLTRGQAVLLETSETVWLGSETAVLIETIRPRPLVEFSRPQPEIPGGEVLTLRVTTLDDWSFTVADTPLDKDSWNHRKAFLVCVYLAEANRHAVPVAKLWEAFWPDTLESGRQGLQTAVSRLRRYFKTLPVEPPLPNPVVFKDQTYSLAPEFEPVLDASVFKQTCAAARQAHTGGNATSAKQLWLEAVELYRQDFLVGYNEGWVERRRLQLRKELFSALLGLTELAGESEESLTYFRKGLEFDSGWEAGHFGVLKCLLQLGRRHEALFHYQECERTMHRLYGQGPSAKLLRLYHTELN